MRYQIGVDLGGTNMAAGLLDKEWSILLRKSIRTKQGATPEELADDMTELIKSLCTDAGITMEEIEHIGIGIPGSVTEDGVVEDANNIGFFHVPFVKMMEERTGCLVSARNDARAAALGEYVAGAGRGSKTFQMLTIGTGIGGAFIVDGTVISGCNGAAGEIGHMVIRRDGAECTCGRRGCLEAYASASALKQRIQTEVAKQHGSLLYKMCNRNLDYLSAKTLFGALEKGDALAKELFDEYIDLLADGVANIINMLQPDVFCIGGGMSEQKEKLLQPLRSAVAERIYSRHSAVQTKITAAELGNDAGIIGAVYH